MIKPTKTARFFQTEHIDEIFHKGQVVKDGVALPLEIEISLIDRCNRHCKCCPRGDDTIAPDTNLVIQPEIYNKLAKELEELGYKGLVMLSGLGEPTLYRDICKVIKAFSFTYVDINSNGDVLTSQKLKEMIDAGANKIMISVYEPENLGKFQDMIKGLEDRVILRNRYDNFDRLFNNRAGAVYEQKRGGICYYPFYLLMVDCNGDVYPCCHEWQRRLKVGNLHQHSLWDIWTGNRLHQVRQKIFEGKRDQYPCRICNVNGTYRGKANFDLYTDGGKKHRRTVK